MDWPRMWPRTVLALPRRVQFTMVVTRRTRSYSWQPRFCAHRSRRTLWWCFSPQKQFRSCDNVEIYCIAGQTTEDHMVHARCMLDNQGYKHTLGICSTRTYCFSTQTMVARTHLNVMLYVHCLSCYLWLQWIGSLRSGPHTYASHLLLVYVG